MSKLSGFEVLTFGANGDTVTFGSDEYTTAGIRTVNLGTGTNSITTDASYVTSALTIAGGTGSDTLTIQTAGALIDLTNVSAIETVTLANGANTVVMGTHDTSITGGTGDDTFKYAIGEFSSSDIVNGGTQTTADTLEFTSSSTSIASTLFGSNVTGIENLKFNANGADTLTFTDVGSLTTLVNNFHIPSV